MADSGVKQHPTAEALIPGAASMRIAIVHTQWNPAIVGALVAGATRELLRHGVPAASISTSVVPGAFELPLGARLALAQPTLAARPDAVLCIGCLIKGETMHFEYISEAVCQGLMRLNLDHSKPVIFGVLECLTEGQALARAGLAPGSHNHGVEWAASALQMVALSRGYEAAK
jgi:6,7-dimethyl-8-ribityllumazine synthase